MRFGQQTQASVQLIFSEKPPSLISPFIIERADFYKYLSNFLWSLRWWKSAIESSLWIHEKDGRIMAYQIGIPRFFRFLWVNGVQRAHLPGKCIELSGVPGDTSEFII